MIDYSMNKNGLRVSKIHLRSSDAPAQYGGQGVLTVVTRNSESLRYRFEFLDLIYIFCSGSSCPVCPCVPQYSCSKPSCLRASFFSGTDKSP